MAAELGKYRPVASQRGGGSNGFRGGASAPLAALATSARRRPNRRRGRKIWIRGRQRDLCHQPPPVGGGLPVSL